MLNQDNENKILTTPSVSATLQKSIVREIFGSGGWLPFDAFMHAALYTPGLGYYTNGLQKFGHMPPRQRSDGSVQPGSDFVTAPELSPLFGQCVGAQIAQVLQATQTRNVYEFGAGTGALALQICELLTPKSIGLERYFIIEISSELRARQQQTLHQFADKITWLDALPDALHGVVIGNEVLDAMPVKLLVRKGGVWHERGVVVQGGALVFADRPTALRPPVEPQGSHDYLTEIHPQAEGFIATVAQRLVRGAAIFIDYGFPEGEYYHPQRHMGTLMCHFQHRADPDPLDNVGLKDITAHVNFSAIALAGQDAGLDVLGYCNQGRFLMNCGLLSKMELLAPAFIGLAAKLATEHEMGELFKVVAFGKAVDVDLIGFAQGDRLHTL